VEQLRHRFLCAVLCCGVLWRAVLCCGAVVIMQVGRDEDGKLGPGWFDVTDSELYPMEEKLRMQVAVEALQVRGGGNWLPGVCIKEVI
jgi:hypothetical protein